MTNILRKNKVFVIIVAAVLVAGIGFGAGMMAKSSLAAENHDIGAEQAKAIALSNVGVSAEKATFTKAQLDDDGHYDIEFYTSSTEYDFEINAADGAVVEKSSEARDIPVEKPVVQEKPAADPAPAASSSSSSSNDASVIGVEAAKKAALNHAGLSSASFYEAYLDHDDGLRVYELEFSANGYEYDYEIHAYNGKVLDWDKERIDYDD